MTCPKGIRRVAARTRARNSGRPRRSAATENRVRRPARYSRSSRRACRACRRPRAVVWSPPRPGARRRMPWSVARIWSRSARASSVGYSAPGPVSERAFISAKVYVVRGKRVEQKGGSMVSTPTSAPPDLAGQVALVTGAGRGIGQAIALALAGVGADVAALDLQPPLETQRRVEALGRRCRALTADVGHRPAVADAVNLALAHFGRLDIVVNNAGVVERQSLEQLDEATLQRELDVIVRGTILVSQSAYPHLKGRGGAIVNIASVSGMAGGAVPRSAASPLARGGGGGAPPPPPHGAPRPVPPAPPA